MRNAIITIAAGLMLMTVTSGCASWTTSKPKNNNSMWSRMQFWKKPYQRPQKMAAIWTHDILTMTAKPPTRGFGGRIYFYNDKSQAIPVDGELIVHGYEEVRGRTIDAGKTKADKTFMFTAEQFTNHFSASELGASYSVWIPWDAADGMQKEITLIPAFKGTNGSLVQGEPAKLILPGRTIEEPNRTTPFQHVSFQQSEIPTADGPLPVLGGMKTTTISRPTQLNRLAKKSTRSLESETAMNSVSRRNNSYTTEVQYGNNPAIPAGSQQTSKTYSLYPDQTQGANAVQNVSMPIQNNLPNGQSNGSYPNLNHPANSPNTFNAAPNTQYTLPNSQNGVRPNTFGVPGTQPNGMQPSGSQPARPQLPGTQLPGTQLPGTQIPNQMTPGFAEFNPVQPSAVQAAFATQWQPFGQPPIPLIETTQFNNQVRQAGYTQTPIGGQAQGLPQAMQPGQSNLQNRY